MAKSKRKKDLIRRLHAGGVRKSAAKMIAGASDGRRKPAKQVRRIIDDLTGLVSEAEDRLSRGPGKRKAAAKKAARTRKQKAARRSAAARKGARTRAKSAA